MTVLKAVGSHTEYFCTAKEVPKCRLHFYFLPEVRALRTHFICMNERVTNSHTAHRWCLSERGVWLLSRTATIIFTCKMPIIFPSNRKVISCALLKPLQNKTATAVIISCSLCNAFTVIALLHQQLQTQKQLNLLKCKKK